MTIATSCPAGAPAELPIGAARKTLKKPCWRVLGAPLLLLALSCSHTQVWAASGESLDALGQAFVATGHAIDGAYAAGHLTQAQHDKWKAFAGFFKPTFDVACDRWLHGDDTAAQHAAAVLAALASELGEWESLLKGATP